MAKQNRSKPDPFKPAASLRVHFEARTQSQQRVADIWTDSRILFLLGASGSGKTFVALALALKEILEQPRDNGRRKKLMLSRPMIECGSPMGYLPGDVNEKLAPWLAPFSDVLGDMSNSTMEQISQEVEIETVPLELMRGRTIRNAVLVVDEIQNSDYGQMKCLLTRIGQGGRIVLCGDQSQSDLYDTAREVPAVIAARKLKDVPGVGIVNFKEADVVRDPLVREVLRLL